MLTEARNACSPASPFARIDFIDACAAAFANERRFSSVIVFSDRMPIAPCDAAVFLFTSLSEKYARSSLGSCGGAPVRRRTIFPRTSMFA